MPSQSESGGNGGGINHGRETECGDYLSCILGLVIPVQELDMFRDNVIWILVLAETALIEKRRPTSREELIPEFLLQHLDLSLEVHDEGCLFLESHCSDQVIPARIAVTQNLGRTRRVHDDGCRSQTRDGHCDTRVSPFPPPDRRKSLRPKRGNGRRRKIPLGAYAKPRLNCGSWAKCRRIDCRPD